MAALQLKIRPLEIPEYVIVDIPGGKPTDVSINELDEGTLAELLEEFSNRLMEKATKK